MLSCSKRLVTAFQSKSKGIFWNCYANNNAWIQFRDFISIKRALHLKKKSHLTNQKSNIY